MKLSKVFRQARWEYLALAIVLTGIIWTNLHYKFWESPDRIIVHDIKLYYQYLPAVFIYKDIALKSRDTHPDFFKDKVWGPRKLEGRYVNKMTIGLSVLYAPFFLPAHFFAELMGYEPDGYTTPYRAALIISSVFYAFLGFIFLVKLMRRYFARREIAITILAIGLGTNLYFYTTQEPPMSHAYSFFLFTLFLLVVDSWLKKPAFSWAILIGVTIGLIVLVRPSNGIILLVLPLWNIRSQKELKERFMLFLRKNQQVILMGILAFLVLVPQFLFWKYNAGSYLFYGYGEERFFFNDPAFIQGLFSYRKGWLVYTPIMIFSLAGMVVMFFRNRGLFWPVATFTILNFYIVWSWWCWWYGGGFGQRVLIESYALMAFPFAAFTRLMLERKIIIRSLYLLLLTGFISLNIFQTWQYYKGVIHWDSMTRKAYWNIYFRTRPAPTMYEQIDPPDYSAALKGDRR